MVALGTIEEWQPSHGPVTTWMASPAAHEAAQSARRGGLPPTYQRTQHLKSALEGKAMGRKQPRLMVVAWDMPGVCDVAAMTAAINAHVRRHDAYHDWFEFDDGAFVRHSIVNPADIDFVPMEFGWMDAAQIRAHALTTTPGTLEWECFTFGVIQHADYFTFYASIDHLHIDGISAGLIFLDIYVGYQGVPQAAALSQVASYRAYGARQRAKTASLSLSSPEIQDWIEFVRGTDGDWPRFPLPLGDASSQNKEDNKGGSNGDFVTFEVLDGTQTTAFDDACRAADARFSGGVLACTALAEYDLTGNRTYHGFTPYDTRKPGTDTLTVGWFASLVPIAVPLGTGSFAEAARAAQNSFDSSKHLADVPFDRVLELATPDELGIGPDTRPATMVSFLDFRKIPVIALWEATNFGAYGDNLSHGGINMWVNRHADKTTVTISFPDNPVARASVLRYAAALTESFACAVEQSRPELNPLQSMPIRTAHSLTAA